MKALKFFGAFFATVGVIGGIGMAIAQKEWPMAIFIALAGVAAVPTIVKWVKDLMA